MRGVGLGGQTRRATLRFRIPAVDLAAGARRAGQCRATGRG